MAHAMTWDKVSKRFVRSEGVYSTTRMMKCFMEKRMPSADDIKPFPTLTTAFTPGVNQRMCAKQRLHTQQASHAATSIPICKKRKNKPAQLTGQLNKMQRKRLAIPTSKQT